MANLIKTVTISELLDGRLFIIPAYQRGYRWETKQIDDLLEDLLKFALRTNHSPGEFYCLQPLIVKQTRWNENVCLGHTPNQVWEVVDGQQRLTSIFILVKYLFEMLRNSPYQEDLFINTYGAKLYHILYETRIDDIPFLENLSWNSLSVAENIDTDHIANAYKEIDRWLKNEGVALSQKLLGPKAPIFVGDTILKILLASETEQIGSVRFIWYELDNESLSNPIDEFLKINNGKIRLTDAELIKALFLIRSVKDSKKQTIKQLMRGLQWEQIENSLQRDDFWCCFSSNKDEEDNRINLLLTLLYQYEHNGNLPIEEGDLFRYFDRLFETDDNTAEKIIDETWQNIIDHFRLMENWYEDPITYNYIGLLNRLDKNIYDIFKLNEQLKADDNTDDFIALLEGEVKQYLKDNIVKNHLKDDNHLDLEYKNKKILLPLFLFLNVNQQNKQITALRKKEDSPNANSPIYKYPFDLSDNQNWNVEHIDSATTNSLKEIGEKKLWINACLEEFKDKPQSEKETLSSMIDKGDYDGAILFIRNAWAEEEVENKDWIGNLTLLDEQTNKSYGNAIFPIKRMEIERRLKEVGVFVPPCTQRVFDKTYGNALRARKWTGEDKCAYHDYIVKEILDFINK